MFILNILKSPHLEKHVFFNRRKGYTKIIKFKLTSNSILHSSLTWTGRAAQSSAHRQEYQTAPGTV